MKKRSFIKEILHTDIESLQKYKDLEYRLQRPHGEKSPEHHFGTEDWKNQVQEIRFRNQHMGM